MEKKYKPLQSEHFSKVHTFYRAVLRGIHLLESEQLLEVYAPFTTRTIVGKFTPFEIRIILRSTHLLESGKFWEVHTF